MEIGESVSYNSFQVHSKLDFRRNWTLHQYTNLDLVFSHCCIVSFACTFSDGIIPKAIFATDPDTDVEPSQRKRRKLQGMEEAETHIALSNATVHWGYFSQPLRPVVTIDSGTEITVEMATHHACDDWDKMVRGLVL